jgi:hypothetical protein
MDHRLASLSACALLLLVGTSTGASAQYAWCARLQGGGENCGFATFAQCQANINGVGGVCFANPRAGSARPRALPDDDFGPRRSRTEQSYEQRQRQIEQQRHQLEQQKRQAEQHKRLLEEQKRRAAAKTNAPSPAPTAAAPAMAVTGGMPLTDLDTNATPALNSDGIRRVQAALKGRGFDPGPINGVIHPQTQVAIRTFQTTFGIEARGVIDNQTLLALGEGELGSRSAQSQPR